MDLQEIIRRVLEISQAAETRGTKVDEALATVQRNAAGMGQSLLELQQQFARMASAAGPAAAPNAQRAALQLLTKEHAQAIAGIADSRGRITLRSAQPLSIRALTSLQGSGDSPATGYDVAPMRDPTLHYTPPRPTTLLDVLQVVPMTAGNTHEAVRLDEVQNSPANEDAGADYQEHEGELKAEALLEFNLITVPVATIAVWTKVSRQLMNDVALLLPNLGEFFRGRVRSKLEREIIAGNGSAGRINGLINQATPYVPGAAHAVDQIGEALASLEQAGFVQPFVLLNPFTWHGMRSQRASTGEYVASVSWATPGRPNVWDAPVIRNSAVPLGDALIVDASAAKFVDRQQPTVMMSSDDGDNFVKNLVTVLAEVRGTVEVTQPAGVLAIDLAAS